MDHANVRSSWGLGLLESKWLLVHFVNISDTCSFFDNLLYFSVEYYRKSVPRKVRPVLAVIQTCSISVTLALSIASF